VGAEIRELARVVVRGSAVALVLLCISALPGPVPPTMREAVRAAHAAAPARVPYARFQAGDVVAWGVLDGDRLKEVEGEPGRDARLTGRTFHIRAVKVLANNGTPR
jgi:hypothetical protein